MSGPPSPWPDPAGLANTERGLPVLIQIRPCFPPVGPVYDPDVAEGEVASLVAAALSGDGAAWNELVLRYVDLVWTVARSHGLGECDAADVSQTTWLRLAESLDRLTDPERLGAWLATTARRESLKLLRERRRQVPSDLGSDGHRSVSLSTEPAADDDRWLPGEYGSLLGTAMSELSEPCQALLRMLCADPAPSYLEVSAALGMPIGSIGPTRARCLDRLRASLLRLSAERRDDERSRHAS